MTSRSLVVREALGPPVTLVRLGRAATAVYRVTGGRWSRQDPGLALVPGDLACVETALDGKSLLALRIFLGASCGPA